MKVFKSKKDKFGWYLVIHLLKYDNCLRIFRKKDNSKFKKYEKDIDIWEDNEIELLEKALQERTKQTKTRK